MHIRESAASTQLSHRQGSLSQSRHHEVDQENEVPLRGLNELAAEEVAGAADPTSRSVGSLGRQPKLRKSMSLQGYDVRTMCRLNDLCV